MKTAFIHTGKTSPDRYHWGSFLRGFIFIIFYILSLRSVVVYLNYLTGTIQLISIIAVLAGLIASWWKPVWVLCLFVACVPLISGIQEMGVLKSVPLLSFLFSIIYISWFSKYYFLERKSLKSNNIISNGIDSLAGLIYMSMSASICIYPPEYSLYRLKLVSISGQFDPFWFMEAGYVVLQGMFLYRMFELTFKDKKDRRFIVPCIYCHAAIVLIFAGWEIITKFAGKNEIEYIFSPFQDPHSYGGYVLILFFYFAYTVIKKRKFKFELPLVLGLLFCIFLSGSTVTVITLLIVGFILGALVLEKRKKIIFLMSFFVGILILIYALPGFVVLNKLTEKYSDRLNYSKILEHKTVTERFELWNQGLDTVQEFPITGSGIGSFFKISNYYYKNKTSAGEPQNAHNYYLQFASELGIPALFLLLLILFLTYKTGLQKADRGHGRALLFGISAYLLSMLTGHHLILSTHQFLFWFILVVVVLSRNDDVKLNEFKSKASVLNGVLCLIVIIAISGHMFNFLNKRNEAKGLYDFGLYKPQLVQDETMYWINQQSRQKVHAKTDYLGFSLYAEPENTHTGVLEIEIYLNEKLVDHVVWKKKGFKHRYYHVPGIKDQILKIKTIASDRYNPYKSGSSRSLRENRDQSAAITDITFFKIPITRRIITCIL